MFAAAKTFSLSLSLPSSDRRIHFTEPLPSNDKGILHARTVLEEGFVKYALGIGSVS
jgi:hypothetical protein